VSQAVDEMVVDCLYYANPVFKFNENLRNPAEYVKYTDNILTHIEFSNNTELKQSQDILRRLKCRDIYKFVG
jgi:hypothetical protein